MSVSLRKLRTEIRPGWTVRIDDHVYLNDSRDRVTVETVHPDGSLTLRPARPWSSQGRKFPTMRFTWSGDLEITGRTVTRFRTSRSITSRSMPGKRQPVKTFVFAPPREH